MGAVREGALFKGKDPVGEELRRRPVGPRLVGGDSSGHRSVDSSNATAAKPTGSARPMPRSTTMDARRRQALVRAATQRHRRHLEGGPGDEPPRPLAAKIIGGIGTLMVLFGLGMAMQVAFPPPAVEPEVLAVEIQSGSVETVATEPGTGTGAGSLPSTTQEPEQPLGPIASSTSTTSPPESSSSSTQLPGSAPTTDGLPPESDPIALDSTTTTSIVTETPTTTTPGEVSTTSTTTAPRSPQAPSTTQVPQAPVTTSP